MKGKYSFDIGLDYDGKYRINVTDDRGGLFQMDPILVKDEIDGLNKAAFAEDNKEVMQLTNLVAQLMEELAEIKGLLAVSGQADKAQTDKAE